jgi:hypothetical protein
MSECAAWWERRLIGGAKSHELAPSNRKPLGEWDFPVKKVKILQKFDKNNLQLGTQQTKSRERGCTVNPDEMLRKNRLECCCVGDEPVAEHVQKLRSLGGSDGNRIIRQAANRE